MKLLITFLILSIINVIGSTVRSILTIKGNKTIASISNATYFAFYNIVMIYTVADFPLWEKCLITFICNLIGVYLVKLIEEKKEPTKMWKIEMALPDTDTICPSDILDEMENNDIPNNYQKIGDWWIYNCYCDTPKQTAFCKKICNSYNGKISAYESKNL